jgi:hypothetical protein
MGRHERTAYLWVEENASVVDPEVLLDEQAVLCRQ